MPVGVGLVTFGRRPYEAENHMDPPDYKDQQADRVKLGRPPLLHCPLEASR